jgi:hypothetical protein
MRSRLQRFLFTLQSSCNTLTFVKTSLKVVSINDRAVRDLRYIRETMERVGSFTAVPGWGGVLMGATALITGFFTKDLESRELWFVAWMVEAALAGAIGVVGTLRKAKMQRALLQGPGRKFAMSLLPALVGGAILTGALYQQGLFGLMPGVWLLLYGVAVMSCGTYSVKVVPTMGAGFMILGGVALLLPWQWAQLFMAAGFGVLQIISGIVIARKYGG